MSLSRTEIFQDKEKALLRTFVKVSNSLQEQLGPKNNTRPPPSRKKGEGILSNYYPTLLGV